MSHNIGAKIKEIRESKGLSQDEVGKKAGITGAYIGRLERGDQGYTNPTIETVKAIAETLKVNFAELVGERSKQDLSEKNYDLYGKNKGKIKGRPVPVLGKASCGLWKDFNDLGYPEGHADEWIQAIGANDPNAFYIIAHGDSMIDGDIQEGDYLLVEPSKTLTTGCKVLAKDPKHGCTVKLFFKEKDGRIRLQPMNPKYEPIYVESGDDFRAYRITQKTTKF